MSEAQRTFTLEQANAIVAAIRPLMGEILKLRQTILEQQPLAWPAISKAAGNGGSQAASELALEFGRLDALVRQIQATGAVVKDLNMGLVDFPSALDGRTVYLCWRYGEEQIEFWHEMDAGFSSRQSL